MIPGLLGTKVGMTNIITELGAMLPVTVIKAGPCVVLQVKTKKVDGYDALQLGFGDKKPHRATMPHIGHAAKAKTGPKCNVREFRIAEATEIAIGDVINLETFGTEDINYIDVSGVTKGKGFAGVMKRHGFGGKEASHGVERKHRSAGGIGGSANAGTGRAVKKGKRMAGRMGYVRCTAQSMQVLKVDTENDLMIVLGSVPGPAGSLVEIRRAKKKG